MNNFYLFVLINGFLAISFEILAIRLFAPFFGSGTIQTSLIIGTVLLFYSVGNFFSHYHTSSRQLLKRNVLIAIFFHGIVLTHPSLNFLTGQLNKLNLNPSLQLVLINLIVLAPLAFLYGQNLPSLLDLDEKKKNNFILGFGTIGSFLGSVLTAILLVFIMPASWMVILNTLLCFLLGFWLLRKEFVFTSIIFMMACYLNLYQGDSENTWETGVALYGVDTKGNFKGLKIDNAKYHSFIISGKTLSPYNEIIHDQLLNTKKTLDVLVLGAGGMALSIKNPHHRYYYVDIDPRLKEVISKEFNQKPVGEFIFSDARAFLINNKKHYDLIIQDAYSRYEIPPHLLTKEHFITLKSRLKPGGHFAMNLSHDEGFETLKALRIHKTIRSVFAVCLFLPHNGKKLHESHGFQQLLVICPNIAEDTRIRPLTDDEY